MKQWLKCDFHIHTSKDLLDVHEGTPVPYSPKKLIRFAASKGYHCLAMSHHDMLYFNDSISDYAKKHDIVLIPAVERTIEDRHVLILNVKEDLQKLQKFSDLSSLAPDTFVIIAHPYYKLKTCGGKEFEQYHKLFDGVEYNAFYPWFYNKPNEKALKSAKKYGKVVVGNSDSHALYQMNHTFSLVKAEKNVKSVINALKTGDVKLKSKPMPSYLVFIILFKVILGKIKKLMKRLF